MNNKLLEIQEMLMNQMRRLDNDKIMEKQGADEIYRSNALSNEAGTYIKIVNTNIRIMEIADKMEVAKNSVAKDLGIED